MSQPTAQRGRRTGTRFFKSAYNRFQRFTALLALFSMLCFSVLPARAGVNTWTAGSTTDFNWDTILNWSLGATPTATDDVIFDTPVPNPGSLSNPNVITLGALETAKSLTFNDTYTLNGGDLTLGAAGNVTVASTFIATINSALGGAGGLTLAAPGGGTLVLGGTNTYSGVTAINAGTLSFAASNNLGDASLTNTISIDNGATLRNTGATVDLGVNRAIAIGAAGGTIATNAGTNLTVSGNLTGTGALTVGGGGLVILNGNGSGYSGNVTVDATGATANTSLRIGTNNSITSGTLTINQGVIAGGTGNTVDLANGVTVGSGVTLVMNSNVGSNLRSALTTQTGATATFAGAVTLMGDGLDQFNSAGTLNVTGNITGDPGFTGTLFIRGGGTGTITGNINIPNGSLNKTDGGTWTINPASQVVAAIVETSDGTMKIGSSNILPTNVQLTMGQASGTNGILDLNGFNQSFLGLQLATGSTSTGTRVTNSTGTLSTLTLTGGGTYATNGIIGNTGQTNIALVLNGTGQQTLSGNSVYVGGTTLNSGTLLVGNNGAVGTGPLVYNGGVIGSNGANTFTLTNSSLTVTPTTVNFGVTGNNGAAILGAALDLGGVVKTINSVAGGGGFAGLVSNGGLIKTGPGNLILSSATANTFAGGLVINDGVVMGNSAIDNFGNGGAGTITINGGGFGSTFNGTYDPAATRIFNFTNASGPGIINITNAGSTGKILINDANQLVGSAPITKIGPGTLQIAAANNLTGNWTVNAGQIEMQNVAGLGTGTVTANGIGTTTNTANGELVVSGITIGGTNNITLNGGILSSNNQAALSIVNSNVNVAANSTIAVRQFQNLANFGNLTINTGLTGSANLTVVGPNAGTNFGTLFLNGNNSGFTGGLTINSLAAVQFNATASVIPTVTLNGGRANYYQTPASAQANVGQPGVNATYYNFGSNPNATTNPNNYAVDQLYIDPRAFTRTDANLSIPQPGASGTYPVLPVPGFGVAGVGGVNDGFMWKGLLNITNAGSYQFSGTDDDNLSLYIDGQLVGTLGVIATNTNIGSALNLSAGYHSILVKQSQGTGGGYGTISYNGLDTGNATTLIPQSALNTGSFTNTLQPTVITAGTGTLDVFHDSVTPSLDMAAGTGLSVLSIGISNLTVSGATTLNGGTNTFSPTTGSLTFNGAIGETQPSNVTMAGPYLATFNAVNAYTGLTTVTGGELDLNATGGNSIQGNLTVNAANAGGPIRNVRLLKSDQIADTATVTMTSGVLDLGTRTDVINALIMNGGTVMGSAGNLLTINDLSGSSQLNAGTILANIDGTGGFVKNGAGLLTLGGNNLYTGTTVISSGSVLRAASAGALGATGLGNGTSIGSGGQLQFLGANSNEDIVAQGTGLNNDGAIRGIGSSTLGGSVAVVGGTVIQSDAGRLTFSNAGSVSTFGDGDVTFQGTGDVMLASGINFGGTGNIIKTGSGTLFFGNNNATFPVSDANWTGGVIGFSGPQSFGSYTPASGKALRFESNPGAGVTLNMGANNTVIGGHAADQSLLSRVSSGSTGTLALAADSSNNLDFSGGPNLGLASLGLNTYSGTITPNGAAYKFTGLSAGLGNGVTPNVLTVAGILGGNNTVNVAGGDVKLNAVNTFTGPINVTGGGTLRIVNNDALGNPANVVNLDGGTLQLMTTSNNAGQILGQLGNPTGSTSGTRTINIGAGGGTIDVTSLSTGNSAYVLTGPNSLTGSGALTKSGLGFLIVSGALPAGSGTQSFSGSLTIAANGGNFDIRGQGALPNVSAITINQSGALLVDNNATLGQARQFPNAYIADRINNAATITMNGGSLTYSPRGAAGQTTEVFGALTLGVGQSGLNTTANVANSVGAIQTYGNITRTPGGTLRIGGNPGTLGGTGANNTQITFANLAGSTVNALPGWAYQFGTDFVGYNATTGIVNTTYTAQAAAAFTPVAANVYNLTATGSATLNAGDSEMFGLRFGGGNVTQTLAFNAASQKLALTGGGIITDNNAQNRDVGTTALRGVLTAGPLTGNATPQELYLHSIAASLRIFSTIVDNNGQPVTVTKDENGTAVIDAPNNTYSGGTFVTRGTLTVNNTGGLGTGLVTVKNSILNLGNIGSVGGSTSGNAAVYFTPDQGQIVLTNNTNGAAANYSAPTDRFNIATGGSIYANSPGVGFGLNSLTRVDTPTSFNAGGQVYLAPGAIVKHNMTNAPGQGAGTLTINNLGTNADLYFSPGNNGGPLQTVTLGVGTPWKGMSSERNSDSWNQGTIFANSDFYLQGLLRDGGYSVLTLGNDAAVGPLAIVNNTAAPINAVVVGQVALAKDSLLTLPSNLTFVLTPGSVFQPNRAGSLGQTGTTAKILVQGGGTLDPGNYVALGSAANQDTAVFQNLAYPAMSTMNGSVTVEAGGRMLVNDASGVGSAAAGLWTMKAGSILQLDTANAFFGRGTQPLGGPVDTTGVINAGQFVYEPGAIVRIGADNIYKLGQFVSAEPNGDKVVMELVGANRSLTNQNNPFLKPVTGTPTISPSDITLGGGGMLTNDASDRQANEGRGRILLNNGAILAATNQTTLSIQDGLDVVAGATVFIGTNRFIDSQPKAGQVNFNGANSNTAGAGATFTVLDGSSLQFGAQNVFPDTANLSLPTVVTSFPLTGAATTIPGNGSMLVINSTGNNEVMGKLDGNGAVIGNVANTGVAVGFGVTGDFTSNVVFKNINNPELYKVGAGKMTLTGTSDSTSNMGALQGILELAGNGSTKFATVRAMKGATIQLDNSVTALNNRTGTPSFWVPSGGTYNVIGNATTPVVETIQNLAISVGQPTNLPNVTTGYTFLNVTPGAASTSVLINAFEHPANNGIAQQRSGTWVLRSPTVANLPGTYGTNGVYTPAVGNASNGVIAAAIPNFIVLGTGSGNPTVAGMAGSPLAPARGDFLVDSNATGQGTGFATEDYVVFNGTTATSNNVLNLTAGYSTTNLAVGMLIGGAGIPSGTVITGLTANSITMSNSATAAATVNFNVVTGNGVRALTASEYTSTILDNVVTGTNVKLTGSASPVGDTRFGTLTMAPGSALNIGGTTPLAATPSRVLLNGAGVFVQSGGAATINGDPNAFLQVANSFGLYLHTQGDLNLNARIFSDQVVTKTGAGTLNAGAGVFSGLRGSIEVDGGVLNMVGGNNTAANVRNGLVGFNAGGAIYANGGTLNLNGNSQLISLLTNNNPLGVGGTVTSASAATLTVQGGGQFSGNLTGAIALDKVNTNTLTLLGANTNTGDTAIRAGTLELRDQGTLSGTSNVNLYYGGTLTINNSYLGNVADRINPAASLNVRGGNIQMTGAPGQVSSQSIATMNLLAGRLDYNGNSGGSGAIVFNVGNLVRPAGTGSTFTINQNFGFVGTAGNTTDAIRVFVNNTTLGGNATTPLTLNDGIIGGWAIMNGAINGSINFMTYNPAVGIGTYGNTADGFPAYESADITAATATQNVNDVTAARTLTASKTVNAYRIGPNAATTVTMNAGVGLTLDTGGLIIDNNNTTAFSPAASTTGQSLTSNSGELDVWINQNTATFNVPVTGNIDLVKSGGGTLALAAQNTFTGKTFVNSGTLNLSLAGANGTTVKAVAGDVVIQGSGVVTETVANQLGTGATITLLGNARFNAMNAAGITETIGAIKFGDAAGAPAANSALDLYDRTASQPTSTLNLSLPVAISGTNTNPNIVPFIGTFAGILGFTNSSGAGSTIDVSAPTTANGLAAVALRIDAAIGAVPTGVAEGGLIKKGTGMFVLNPGNNTTQAATGSTTTGSSTITMPSTTGLIVGQTITGAGIPAGSYITGILSGTQVTLNNTATATATGTIAFTSNIINPFGNPATLTDTINVVGGILRADQSGALGSQFVNTTVQSGAGIINATANSQAVLGSIRLKDGSFLGATLNNPVYGAASTSTATQSILNVPSGNVTIFARDYFVPTTNGATITVNSKLTGAGNINLVGPEMNAANGTGTLVLSNPITTGTAGANDYTGAISIGVNAILQSSPNKLANAGTTGGALGAATINLNGGQLQIRDDGNTAATGANLTLNYANNLVLNANSILNVDRANGTATANTVNFNKLTIPTGSPVLNFTNGNNYVASFNQLDGAGTLVKAGQGPLVIGGYAGTYAGGLTIAGPQARNVAPTFSSTTLANVSFSQASNTFSEFNVNGLYTLPASRTFNVTNFNVNPNPGNVTGMLAVTGTTTVNATNFANNGQVGATGGAATITASAGFTGSGHYITSGQSLTLAGDVTAGTLRVGGNNTVSVTGANLAPAAVEVQSGTLRIAPVAPATSTGNIRVFGLPAQTVATNNVPVAAISGVLNFDGAANPIVHTGSITNNGVVRVSSGSTTVSGMISGTATQYVPGLLEGYTTAPGGALDATAARVANPGNFGIRLEPRMFQTNAVTQQALTGHTDNDTWVYTGYVKDDDGVFSFAENVDDRAAIWVDGVLVLNAANGGTSRVVSTAYSVGQAGTTVLPTAGANLGTPSQNFGPGVPLPGKGNGWHLIELRFNNGAGGAGPIVGNGFNNNYGLGYKNGIAALDGADMIKPIDDGTGNLFVTPVGGKGNIDVLAGSTLNAAGFSLISNITLGSDLLGATLNATAAGANDADNLSVTGVTGSATFSLVTGATAAIQNVSVAAGTRLTMNGGGQTTIGTGLTLDGNLTVANHTLISNVAGTGSGSVAINTGGVISTNLLADGGSPSGIGASSNAAASVTLNGGTLLYTGPAAATDRLFTLGTLGGTIDSSGAGALTFTNTGSIGFAGVAAARVRPLTLTGAVVANNVLGVSLNDLNTGVGDLTSLTKTGATTWVLTNANAYTGGTTISTGTLQLGNGTTAGSIVGDVANAGVLAFNEPVATSFDGVVSGAGSVAQNGPATVTLTNNNTYAGGTTIAAGSTLQVGNGGTTGSVGTGPVAFGGAGATLAFNRSDNLSVTPGVISGVGSVAQNGTGKVTLAGINTYTGSTAVNDGTLAVTGSIAASSGVTVAATGVFEAAATQTVKSLTLTGGQAKTTMPNYGSLKVGDGTIAAPLAITGGKVDLTSNGLVVDFSAGNENANVVSVRDHIIAGRNGGTYDGATGITSSAAALTPNNRAVGYAQANEVTLEVPNQFLGQTVDATSILVRFTLNGDADLDGKVGFSDLVAVAQHYDQVFNDQINNPSTFTDSWWVHGDFDYDGKVGFSDLVAVAQNYDGALPSLAVPGASVDFNADLAAAFAGGAVPEPGTIGLLGLAGLALLRRRRR